MTDDVFGTAGVRERVLAGWAAAPVRFREDANAEEELALGGYVDRLVVELAQNAADAAARAGVRGRVLFEFRNNTLVVANTGAPLDAEGVQSLATLRASAKRADPAGEEGAPSAPTSSPAEVGGGRAGVLTVGRFGVGFSAVLAVTDEPVVLSRSGGVRFSKADTAAAIAGLAGELDTEVRRRDGQVPVLRLPFEADGEPPADYDTAVILPLRDEAAAALVRRLLAEADDALLLALPGLERIEIETADDHRVLQDVESRWHIHRAAGTFTTAERDQLLADRPTEERSRPNWSVVWALPRAEIQPQSGAAAAAVVAAASTTEVPAVVHAPTPTDEPLSLGALLLASFPLDSTRRHVAKGPLTDRLVKEAATAYGELLRARVADGDDVLHLVPTGLAAGALDRVLRDEILQVLPGVELLHAVEDGVLRPRDAVVVEGADDAFNTVLAPIVPGLIPARREDRLALDALQVRRLELAEVVDQLGGDEPPAWWRHLYSSLTAMVTDPLIRESLGTLPVPLADGRLVRGARGLLLPGPEIPVDILAAFGEYGVRVVHPDAVDPALERLGAIPATPRSLLEDSSVRTAVEHSADADDPDAVAHAVLSLVAADPAQAEGLWWLNDLVLRDAEGELVPANALVVEGSDAQAILDPDEVAPIARDILDRYGLPALEAVGVLATLGVVAASDVALDQLPEAVQDLDAIEDWAYDVAPDGSRYGATVGELEAIRDLDWITDDNWPKALQIMGSEPDLRRALVTQVRIVGPDDRPLGVPSYAAWWIREHVLLDDGEPLAGRADPEAEPVLATFLDEAPTWTTDLDPEVRTAVGLVRDVGDLDADGISLVLDRLADPERDVDAASILRLWTRLGTLALFPGDAPEQTRVLDADGATRVIDADQAVVIDGPMWVQREDLGGFVIGSGAAADGLSDLLDVPMAQEIAEGKIDGEGTAADVPPIVRELVPEVPATWWEHEELTVDGVEVSWWVDADGAPHAATFDGLAKALAWSAGRWDRRHVIRAVLNEPDRSTELLVDAVYD
ncbi:sacsin N-terminal ATP-binding-like domain-containing protein [Kribbella sp. NPDC058693]|uniref:sacsin N-terminal ATP-binding-like domain-containing protein n=1 Tax=Kribbella sp. NPDC058693 TaxID=3346602 RepID=UPI003663AFD3